jgi:nitrogen regulatory protein P-II 1
MKELRAIVRPTRLGKLQSALRAIPGFPGMTVLPAQGFTAPASLVKRTVKDELTEFSDKCMVCILVTPELENVVRDTLLSACQTGNTGDGLLWSVEAQQVQRIRDQQTLA